MSRALLVALLWVHSSTVFAYELGTHSRITQYAFTKSVLSSTASLLKALDIPVDINSEPFGNEYYDISFNDVRIRTADTFSTDNQLIPDNVSSLSMQGWLMRGAIREDDIPGYWPFNGENPQDDPDGEIVRVRNHFYDPVNQRPLTVKGIELGADAPTWAMGVQDAFGCPNCEDTNRRNHFTLQDAREAMWRALTGKDKTGNTAIGPNGAQSDEMVRNAYWATLFRSLGDVLHLVQDMGQSTNVVRI